MKRASFASFWHGAPLSFLEKLCLKSFADHGHRIRLYTYDPTLEVPPGVERADAAQILPRAALEESLGVHGPAPFADRFRINMIHKTGETWTDCDVVCLAPVAHRAYAFARAGRVYAIGVLHLPKTSRTLAALMDFVNAPDPVLPADWPWPHHLSPEQRATRDAAGRIHLGGASRADLPYQLFGARAFTYFLERTGEDRHARPTEEYYSLSPVEIRRNYYRPRLAPVRIAPDVPLVHGLGGKPFRQKFATRGMQPPHPASFAAALCARHGISPEIETEPARAAA